jgi:hypothetical protein
MSDAHAMYRVLLVNYVLDADISTWCCNQPETPVCGFQTMKINKFQTGSCCRGNKLIVFKGVELQAHSFCV